MGQETLNRIWSVITVTLLYLSLNAWSLSQQWQLSLPGNPFKDGKFTPHGVTLIALPLCGTLLVITSLLTVTYARQSRAKSWASRFPRFANLPMNMAKFEGRFAQACSLSLLLIVPSLAQLHFGVKFLAGTAYRGTTRLYSGMEHLTHFVPLGDAFSGRYTYDRLNDIAPTFFPFWEPWAFGAIETIVLCTVLRCLWAVFSLNRTRSA